VNLNPLNTLTGRMVLVTMAAVALAYGVAFVLFSNERGAALRRAGESATAERVIAAAERLRTAAPERRVFLLQVMNRRGLRASLSTAPEITRSDSGGERIARTVSERLGGADVRAVTRAVAHRPRRFDDDARFEDGRHGRGRGRGGHEERVERHLRGAVEIAASVQLDSAAWFNVIVYAPAPRPAPWSLIIAGLAAVIAVGIGAALVSRQIGRPLADLASAARRLGTGDQAVQAPVRGPEDVRRAAAAFNAMAERLSRQLGRQRQMLWALSHDLRTPITALRLRAELIEDEAARQRFLAPLAEMEALTEQALSLARAGASGEARARVDLAEIVRTLAGELADMGLAIRAEADQPLWCEVRPSEIARALRNLAENAVKHGGGGVMRARRNDRGEAVLDVIDEGPGVSDDMLARLAEPFFRADSARTQSEGAGLGLAIAQAIAEAHGGRLLLQNVHPRGFRASLLLPC
jgi:signal transduction histidine kinase